MLISEMMFTDNKGSWIIYFIFDLKTHFIHSHVVSNKRACRIFFSVTPRHKANKTKLNLINLCKFPKKTFLVTIYRQKVLFPSSPCQPHLRHMVIIILLIISLRFLTLDKRKIIFYPSFLITKFSAKRKNFFNCWKIIKLSETMSFPSINHY